MPNDYEALARALINSPQGANVLKNLDKIRRVINTPEGRRAAAMMAGDGGDALKQAAAAAAENDRDAAKALLSSLLSTKEGAALAAQIISMIGG